MASAAATPARRTCQVTPEFFSHCYNKEFGRTIKYLSYKHYSEPEELAQWSWARAWEKREQWKGDCSLYAWVCSIATNRARMLYRSAWRSLQFGDGLGMYELSDTVDSKAKIRCRQALSFASAEDRSLLDKWYLQEVPAEVLAESLGLTINAVKIRVIRARRKLRERLVV